MGVKNSDAKTEGNNAVFMNTDLEMRLTNCTFEKETFRFPTKYILKEAIGRGSYGLVWSGYLRQSKERVAIKKIDNVVENTQFLKNALREVRILRHLNHENIISIRDVFVTESRDQYKDVYIVMELLRADLTTLLKSGQPLNGNQVTYFAYQIIRGLKYVHSAGVIHRDLKPRNCLIQLNCDLKICDFGLARAVHTNTCNEVALPLTPFLCTRWYRPPEILCKRRDYTDKVDMWSAGCILAEILRRVPLFKGRDTMHQLVLIIRVIGVPSEKDIVDTVHSSCREFVRTVIPDHAEASGDISFNSLFPEASAALLNFLQTLLRFNPHNRPTASEALQNPYFSALHDPNNEPVRALLPISEFEFERRRITHSACQEELFREILQYYPKKRQEYLAQVAQQSEFFDVELFSLQKLDDFANSDEISCDED